MKTAAQKCEVPDAGGHVKKSFALLRKESFQESVLLHVNTTFLFLSFCPYKYGLYEKNVENVRKVKRCVFSGTKTVEKENCVSFQSEMVYNKNSIVSETSEKTGNF